MDTTGSPTTDGSGETDSPGAGTEGTNDPPDTELPEGYRVRAVVTGVERVPGSVVPESFPIAIWTDEALALDLRIPYSGAETRTYFSLPETAPDDRLKAFMDRQGVAIPDALEGAGLVVDIRDGHAIPLIEPERRGDARGIYGILAGLTPSIAITLLPFFGLGEAVSSSLFFGLFLVGTFIVLPISLYLDAWHLKTSSDWDGTPFKLAVLAIIPPLYIIVAPYYLIKRENAMPLAFEPRPTP